MFAHPYPLPVGCQLHQNYRIQNILGAGGFGITYLAEHILLRKQFVIKEYFPSDMAYRHSGCLNVVPYHNSTFHKGLNYFYREAQLLNGLNHPNIVPVADLFEDNHTAYFVMPHIGGITLAHWLAQHPQPTTAQLETLFLPLLAALSYIHSRHIFHRDIKPHNILLQTGSHIPMLLDFGAARCRSATDTDHHSSSLLFVSHGYSPIEQYAPHNVPAPHTDLYSLSACLYHAVTGRTPPTATERISHTEIPLHQRPELTDHYPSEFLRAIDQGFSMPAADRHHSAADMRRALTAYRRRPTLHIPRHRTAAALLGSLLITGGLTFYPAYHSRLQPTDPPAASQAASDPLQRQAEAGDTEAQNQLGMRYTEQDNPAQAKHWFRQAAERGHAKAQFNLGWLYAKGQDQTPDPEQAEHWLARAAAQGDSEIQNRLGLMYAQGEGIPQDDVQALHWFRQAAEHGHAKAQFNLAWMYQHGRGTPPNTRLAMQWYQKSARQGNSAAQSRLQHGLSPK